jgi:autotransporter-associated beta strand protein
MATGDIPKGATATYGLDNLATHGIVLPYDASGIRITQQLSNVVGATRMGFAFSTVSNTPAVGTTNVGLYRQDATIAAGYYTVGPYTSTSSGVYRVGLLQDLDWNATDGTWNTSAVNWKDPAMPGTTSTSQFANGDSANFANTAGGTVTLSGALAPSAVTVQANSGTYTFQSSAGNQISGTAGLTKSGAGTLVLAGANTYSGGTTLNGGTLRAGSDSALGTGVLNLNGGTIASDGVLTRSFSNAISIGGNVAFGDETGTGDLFFSGNVDLGGSVRQLTTNANTTLSGVLSNGGLSKAGSGTLTLSGENTYLGPTSVTGGTLVVNGSLANSVVSIGNGGTLGGSVTINSLVTVLAGGTLSPGNSPGLITVGAIDLQAGSLTKMEIVGSGSNAGSAGTDFDQLAVTTPGGMGYGGDLELSFSNLNPFNDGTVFNLFSFSGAVSRHFASVFTTGSGPYAGFSLAGNGGVWTGFAGGQKLTFNEASGELSFSSATAVPEPSSLVLSGLGTLGLVWMGRRQRRGVKHGESIRAF